MPDPNLPPDELSVQPTTLELLVAQLHPERARSCQTAIILARTGVDEIHDRAHARPLDETDDERG